MELLKHTCQFTGGMNKDLSVNNYPNTCYLDAQNFRLISGDSTGLTDSSLTTPKGNALSFTIPNSGKLLGYTVLRDYLVILVHADGEVDPDRIYKVYLDDLKIAGNITLTNTYYWGDVVTHTRHLVYKGDLNFSLDHPIKVVGNYENSNVQKIYWVDGLNSLRHLNLIYNATYNNLTTLNPELLEISPNNTYGLYTLTEEAGGHLKAGRVQYSYQLYSVAGSETMFAPPSNLYNVTTYNITDKNDFAGSEAETIVNKNIKISIALTAGTSSIFNRIRLVALDYELYGDVPTVRIVAEQALVSDNPVFYDYGNTIGEILLEEFQVIRNDFIPKTIESKNNYLFAGNITEEFFDVDSLVHELDPTKTFLDTRTYRWRYSDTPGAVMYSSQILDETTDPAGIANTSGYEISGVPTNSFDIIFVPSPIDNYWHLHMTIGAVAHAAGLGRTVTSIASITNAYVLVHLYRISSGLWDDGIGLILDLSDATFTFDGTDQLEITGTKWFGTPPSGILGYPGDFSNETISVFSYTYNYSYITAAAIVDCMVNKGFPTGELVIDDGTGPDFTIVPENHDCINTYNNIANDNIVTSDHEYKYKEITNAAAPTIADLGGTGPYISYGFAYHDMIAGSVELVGSGADLHPIVVSLDDASSGYKNPQNVLDFTSLQRDEVYRTGITLYDLKGRPSFTKWIADIRTPKMCETTDATHSHLYELCPVSGGDPVDIMQVRALGIIFSIDWDAIEVDYPGLITQLSGFQFVRVIRTDDDSTIKANGIIVPTHIAAADGAVKATSYSTYQITSGFDYNTNTITALAGITGANGTMNRLTLDFISPEIAINKNLGIDPTKDFLQVVGYIDNIQTAIGIVLRDAHTLSAMTVTAFPSTNTNIVTDWRRLVLDGFVSLPEPRTPTSHMVNGVNYTARGYDNEAAVDNPEMTYKGTSLVAGIGSVFTNITSGGGPGEEKALYGYYRKYLAYSIYGGATYTARSYNSYIKMGEFTPTPAYLTLPLGAPTPYTVYGGDVYINPFAFMKLFYDLHAEFDTFSGQVLVTFPVESKINLGYRLDKLNKYFFPDFTTKYYLAENQSIGLSQYPNNYPDIGDLYRYNSVYSTPDISKLYPSKLFDFTQSTDLDVLVSSSELKINGEYSDSWLKFKYNNYLQLEGKYGPITRLINNNDKLIAFQHRGISVLSVLERELVETQNTASLTVGTGGILSRYDYLTKKNGTSIYEGITPTEGGLYFYDNLNNGIYRITDTIEPLSDTKGLRSYYEVTPYTSLISTYDKRHREVLFSPGTTNTLCFSGYINAFTGFYTFNSGATYVQQYITFDKYLISSLDSNIFYLHEAGNYNEFYGNHQTSSLTLIANPNKTQTYSFHIIEWLTDVTNQPSGVDEPTITFDTLQITNTHQDTGQLTLISNVDLKRRFKTWRLNVLRDSLEPTTIGRLRDSFVKVVFRFVQTANHRKLVVHPVTFDIVPTKIK